MDFNKDLELYKSIIQVNNIEVSKVAQGVMGIIASESLKEEKSSGTLTFAKFFSANPEVTQLRQYLGISDAPTEAGDTKVSTSSLIRVMVDSLLLLDVPLEEDIHRQLTCESSTTLKYIMGKSIDTSSVDVDGDKAESLLSKFNSKAKDYFSKFIGKIISNNIHIDKNLIGHMGSCNLSKADYDEVQSYCSSVTQAQGITDEDSKKLFLINSCSYMLEIIGEVCRKESYLIYDLNSWSKTTKKGMVLYVTRSSLITVSEIPTQLLNKIFNIVTVDDKKYLRDVDTEKLYKSSVACLKIYNQAMMYNK